MESSDSEESESLAQSSVALSADYGLISRGGEREWRAEEDILLLALVNKHGPN